MVYASEGLRQLHMEPNLSKLIDSAVIKRRSSRLGRKELRIRVILQSTVKWANCVLEEKRRSMRSQIEKQENNYESYVNPFADWRMNADEYISTEDLFQQDEFFKQLKESFKRKAKTE